MEKNTESDELKRPGKIALFLSSVILGSIVGAMSYKYLTFPIVNSFTIGILFSIVNPFISALFVSISETLHRWAFPQTYSSWPVYKKVWNAAFWPLTIFFWTIISIFFAAINRLFRQ